MDSKSFVAVCFSDLAGQVRGHGVPRAGIRDLYQRGLPWPTDRAALTVFGEAVDTPWPDDEGLCVHPDPNAEVTINFGGEAQTESFVLGTIPTSDHKNWAGCTRSFLQATLDTLKSEFGLDVSCTYEHQFSLDGKERVGSSAMSLSALRREREFASTLATVLENAGITLVRFGGGGLATGNLSRRPKPSSAFRPPMVRLFFANWCMRPPNNWVSVIVSRRSLRLRRIQTRLFSASICSMMAIR